MAESQLTLQFDDLRKAVARFLGWTIVIADWDDEQVAELKDIVNSGYRRFLYPPAIRNETTSHEWQFLKPLIQLDTVADQFEYTLPDSFAGIDGTLSFKNTSETLYRAPVRITNDERIRTLKQTTLDSINDGFPTLAAIVPIETDGSTGQRYQLIVWPTPNRVINMEFRGAILANELNETTPFPLGGMQHSETLKESCLAYAEENLNDELHVHQNKFQRLLEGSVDFDRSAFGTEYYGYNGDSSDIAVMDGRYRRDFTFTIEGSPVT